MDKKRSFLPALVLTALVSFLAAVLVLLGAAWAVLGTEGLSMIETLVLINTRFVGEHDLGEAVDESLDALIEGLGDRWSYYMDEEAYAAQQESRNNAYVGIGVTVTYPEEGGLLIRAVAEEGPAREAGLQACLFLVVQMEGAAFWAPNDRTHPAFGAAVREAAAQGVEIQAWDCRVAPDSLEIRAPVPVRL